MNYTELPDTIDIYIPTIDNSGNELPRYINTAITAKIENTLNVSGYTVVEGLGVWNGDKEVVYILSVSLEEEHQEKDLHTIAKYIKESAEQDAVAIKVNGILRIYS